jgi:hypothetical protein
MSLRANQALDLVAGFAALCPPLQWGSGGGTRRALPPRTRPGIRGPSHQEGGAAASAIDWVMVRSDGVTQVTLTD